MRGKNEDALNRNIWNSEGPLPDHALSSLAEINELALELLAACAAQEDGARKPAMLLDLRELWSRQTMVQRRRLAHCPYLLVDAGFGSFHRWPYAAHQVRDGVGALSWFGIGRAERLASLIMMFAWHLSRTHRLAARLLVGASDDAVDALAALTVRQVEECLDRAVAWLEPRWCENSVTWRRLLDAAASDDSTKLDQARLYGVQLMAGSVWHAENRPK